MTMSSPSPCSMGCTKASVYDARDPWTGRWCPMHYQRWLRLGDPSATVRSQTDHGVSLAWLVNAVATRDRSECWPWPFGTCNGYGKVTYNGRQEYAPTVALLLDGVPQPPNQECCHSCTLKNGLSHRLCCNPSHLRWGTRKENVADAIRAGVVGGAQVARHSIVCNGCGKPALTRNSRARYCSRSCGQRSRRAASPSSNNSTT